MTAKACAECGATFTKPSKSTWEQWGRRRYCSRRCSNRGAATSTPAAERVIRRVDSSNPDACWLWSGATTPDGKYGVVGIERGRNRLTHIVIHEAATGVPVPEGWQVDHLCRVTLCCNPSHLEAVTQAENLRRQQAAITQCLRGHEFTPENTYHPPGNPTRRQCRTCKRLRALR